LLVSGTSWSGRLSESAFLSRLYDLTELPSTDYRFNSALGDIQQHRESFTDWSDDWIFHDPRFKLLHCPDEQFLRFLAESAHPIVRTDSAEAQALIGEYNKSLAVDGWRLVEVGLISGRPYYGAQRASGEVRIFEEPTGWSKVDRQLQEVRQRLDSAQSEEQYQAVGLLCREVLISVGEVAFDPLRHRSLDGVGPSETDAKRRLEAMFEKELGGTANEEARGHAKAAVRLAVALQHKRTADFQTAALCAEATASVANLAAILAGKRR
jgi:hypothetical protein